MPSSESDFNSFVSKTPFELLSCQIWGIFKKILSKNRSRSPPLIVYTREQPRNDEEEIMKKKNYKFPPEKKEH